MKRADIINILFTFVVGLVVGVYLYFAGFAPSVDRIGGAIDDIGVSLTVTGEAYGGCDRTNACPSFHVAPDGTYRFDSSPANAQGRGMREGVLPLALQQRLNRFATPQALAAQSSLVNPTGCESYVDGIDVRYIIELDGELFEIDSCGTSYNPKTQLWQTLNELWDYFQASE